LRETGVALQRSRNMRKPMSTLPRCSPSRYVSVAAHSIEWRTIVLMVSAIIMTPKGYVISWYWYCLAILIAKYRRGKWRCAGLVQVLALESFPPVRSFCLLVVLVPEDLAGSGFDAELIHNRGPHPLRSWDGREWLVLPPPGRCIVRGPEDVAERMSRLVPVRIRDYRSRYPCGFTAAMILRWLRKGGAPWGAPICP